MSATTEPARRGRRGWLIGLVVLALLGVAAWWYLATRGTVSTDDAFTDGRVVTVAPQVAGQVVAVAARDNRLVGAGKLLFSIDPAPYRAALAQAEAAVVAAQAALENARAQAAVQPTLIAAAAHQMAANAADLMYARQELARQRHLLASRVVGTLQAVQQATATVDRLAAIGDADAAQLATARARVKVLAASIDAAAAALAQRNAALSTARLNLGYTRVTAPQAGWVTRRAVEVGSYVQPGQATLSLVTPDIWITANLKESDLAGVHPGEPVDIAIDAYPRHALKGVVDSQQMGSGAVFTAFPPENATGNYVKIVQRVPVRIRITGGLDPRVPLALGLSVVPTIHTR